MENDNHVLQSSLETANLSVPGLDNLSSGTNNNRDLKNSDKDYMENEITYNSFNNLSENSDKESTLKEISKEFSNNLNNVERLVKKLSMMDSNKNEIFTHLNDNILKEIVKIRPLVVEKESFQEIERNEEKEVYYRRFCTEDDLQPVIDLITKDLSEPYSIYTYRYFIYNWPRMCIMAFTLDGKCIGAIVGKTESHSSTDRVRGYIAMLAVQKEYRRRFIGSRLVELVIDTMISDGCSEVVLETEITNKSALSLYEKLGFIRDKRLFRYYLNGVDAFRLKLWMS